MKKSLLLLIVFSFSFCALWAQTKISGIVTDAGNGAPIGYATVAVKGTAVGVTTDAKGAYTIPIPKGTQNATLVFSYVGYDPQEVAVGNRTKIDIALKSSSVDIDEVVVTGYQNLKKQTFTGSSVKLNASDLNVAGTSDISRMLEGKAAGVSVQNVSGTFGAAPKVRIRGVASITGDNKPLWVVDGVVLEDMVNVSNDQLSSGDPTTLLGSSVAGINAEDIETFDILKDAAATAMYGARAMNGVIVITTKRGRMADRAKINYRMQLGFSQIAYGNWDLMNTSERIQYEKELGLTDGKNYNVLAKTDVNWLDEVFSNAALLQNYELSVSGASEKTNYYVSGGYYSQDGTAVGSSFERYSIRANVEQRAAKWLKLGTNTMMNYQTIEKADDGEYTLTTPISAACFITGTRTAPTVRWRR